MKQLKKRCFTGFAMMLVCTVAWYFYGYPIAGIFCFCIGLFSLGLGIYLIILDKRNKEKNDTDDILH